MLRTTYERKSINKGRKDSCISIRCGSPGKQLSEFMGFYEIAVYYI